MDTELFKKRLSALPQRVAEGLDHKKKRVVGGYQSQAKLTSVVRWRLRMAKAGIGVQDLAEQVGKPPSRISEWLTFKVEPTEESFLLVENAIYAMGG